MTREERIEKYTKLFENELTRIVYLVQLNPPAGFKTVDEYKNSLETFKFIKENIKDFQLKLKVKKEVMKYVNKGITLMYRRIHEFES